VDLTALIGIQEAEASVVASPKIPTTAAVLPIKDSLTPFRVMTKPDISAESEVLKVTCTTTLQLTLQKDGVCRTYLAVGHVEGEIYLKEVVDGARLVLYALHEHETEYILLVVVFFSYESIRIRMMIDRSSLHPPYYAIYPLLLLRRVVRDPSD